MSIQTEINRITQLRDEQTSLLNSQTVTIDDIKLALQDKCVGEVINLQEKTVTPTKSVQTVTPDSDYNGLSKVTVNAIPSDYIKPSGTLNITTNGTHNVTNYASASVNVPSEDLSSELNTYETYLSTQETTIEDILSALEGKSVGTGADIINGLIERTLTGTYVNNEITRIGNNSLRTLSITSLYCANVTSVEGEAIRQCDNLVDVHLPKCTSLGSYSLGICPKLEIVELDSVTSIAAYSFYQCTSLKSIIIRTTSKVCSLGNVSALTSSSVANGTGFIYVPDSLVDSYKSATNWSTYANQIKGLSEL